MQKLNSDVANQAMTFEKSCGKLKAPKDSLNKGDLSNSSDDDAFNPKDIAKMNKPQT
jgi:hypothetical protein